MRAFAGVLILAIQLGGIAYARFVPTRYLAWAPYDEIVNYEIDVEVGGRRLSEKEASERYRIGSHGRGNRSWAHLTDIIAIYESTRGRDDGASVRMRYTVNGRGPFVWRWPEQGPHEPGHPELPE
jgi:hypothetical protein